MTDLKPCPSCGDAESVYATQDPTLYFAALCPECGMYGPTKEEQTDAVNAWNDLPRRSDMDAEVARLRKALTEMVYEATHLSPQEDDGSHWCKISRETLQRARAALTAETEG